MFERMYGQENKVPTGSRTRNLLLRRQAPCPLGHRDIRVRRITFILLINIFAEPAVPAKRGGGAGEEGAGEESAAT